MSNNRALWDHIGSQEIEAQDAEEQDGLLGSRLLAALVFLPLWMSWVAASRSP